MYTGMPVLHGSSKIWQAHKTCLYCQMVQVREQVPVPPCGNTGTWDMPANRQAQATVWLPPGHGSCVNRCAKVIRWWPWETKCRNRRAQAAYCVVGIRPMLSYREAGTWRVLGQTCPCHQVPVLHYGRYANRQVITTTWWPWRWHMCE